MLPQHPQRHASARKEGTPTPYLNGAVVLVPGANGDIGTHFVRDALVRGATKVYATARSPRARDDERIVPLTLDVTDLASIDAAVAAAPDVTYSASKAALWSATNSLRVELAPKGVHVMGVHMGYVDTPMAAHADEPKILPPHLVTTVYDAVEAGEQGPVEALYPELPSTNS